MSFYDVRSESGHRNDREPPEDWPKEGAVRISNSLLANTYGRRRVSFETLPLNIAPREKVCMVCQRNTKTISFAAKLMLTSKRLQGEVWVDDILPAMISIREAREAFCILQPQPLIFMASL